MTNTIKLTPIVIKHSAKTLNAIKKALNSYGKVDIQVNVLTETSVEYVADFKHWLQPESIRDVYQEMKDAIMRSDTEGHLFSVQVGEVSVGEHFVEAILSGLRPGMPVIAEAFFPTISYEVKWKNIMKHK